jgi:hypothetical protein
MKKIINRAFRNEVERLDKLQRQIKSLYDHLHPDDVDVIASNFDSVTTTMIEVIKVAPNSTLVMDLCEDVEFKPVCFPEELMPLLRRHDVFLSTMGFKDDVWTVLYLSPPYAT